MPRFVAVVTLGFVLLSLTVVTAAQQAVSPSAESDRVRAEYSNSKDLPEEIAFLETMRFLDFVNKSSSDTAVAFVKQGMGLDEIEAEEFLALMLSTFESLTTDIQNKKYDAACSSGAPKVVGRQVYAALEAMDDIPEHVAGVRLHKLRVEIGSDKAKRLDQWLVSQKLKISHVKYDRKELHTSRGEDADALLAEICAGLVATQPGGSQ